MRVVLQYFDDCPNWQFADAHVREAIVASGRADIELQHQVVDTAASAERLEFRGSPTILIDGVDPFGSPEGEFGLSCRVYREDGKARPAPSLQELRAAFER